MAINREKVQDAAEKLLQRGKVEAAIQEFRKLLADSPKDIALLNRVGDLYVRINRNDEAIRLFLQLAQRYSEDGFFVKAIAIYKKILKFDPTRMVVYERLADLYHKQGLLTEARDQYKVLVDYYQKHGDAKKGAEFLQKIADLDPEDPTPRVKLAEAHHQLGDKQKEIGELKALAEMMTRHGRFDEAAQIYSRAIAAAPDDLAFVTDAVLGLKDAGQVGLAARLLAIAVEKNPQAERIARLAGLGRGAAAPAAAPPVPDREGTSTGLRVRDIAPPPPELEVRPATSPAPPAEPEFIVELPEDSEPPSTEIRPTESMLRRSPESPWFDGGMAADVEFELELEIEGVAEAEPPAAAATPAAAEPAPKIEWDFEGEQVLELPELGDELPPLEPELPPLEPALPPLEPAPPPRPEPTVAASPFEVGLDLEELERTSYEVVPEEVPAARRLGDLLAEAEVFRKYGLTEKAHDRVREILHHDPGHLEAMSLQVALLLDEGKHDRVLARAQALAELAARAGESGAEIWHPVQAKLTKAGYRFEGSTPVATPAPRKPKKDSVSDLLADLVGLTGDTRKAKPPAPSATPPKAPVAPRPAPAPAPAAAPPAPAAPVPPRPAPPRPAPAAPAVPAAAPRIPAPPPAPPRPPAPPAAAADSLAWLDEVPKTAPPPAAPPAPAAPGRPLGPDKAPSSEELLFEDEEGFFDLAAELEKELTNDEIAAAMGPAGRDEPSLEEIVEGFKKGVAESLSAEDYDTHFNLGIAYREMGLIDEAIGEFQLAAKDSKYLIDCCSLLGACFLEKGLPELAVKWYRKGLEVPDLPEEATLGLLYDLGNLYLSTGDAEKARKTFVEIYGVNSNYRDVIAKLEELGHG
jgi:tetratricopeptide (TPR) repeat protein